MRMKKTCEISRDMSHVRDLARRENKTRSVVEWRVTCLSPAAFSHFFYRYGMADRDGFLMRMFNFLEWKSTRAVMQVLVNSLKHKLTVPMFHPTLTTFTPLKPDSVY